MPIEVKNITASEPSLDISCSNCDACCCRLEVMLLSDTGVPEKYVYRDHHGKETMLRYDDGWCSALNRDTLMCTIYDNRPWVCRIFEVGSNECIEEREEQMLRPL